MADLDNRSKRGSAIVLDLQFGKIWPNPDGTIAQLDRQHIAYKYSGILSSSVSTIYPISFPLLGFG